MLYVLFDTDEREEGAEVKFRHACRLTKLTRLVLRHISASTRRDGNSFGVLFFIKRLNVQINIPHISYRSLYSSSTKPLS